jgi:TonB family protein
MLMIRQKMLGACFLIINLIAAAQPGNQVSWPNGAACLGGVTRPGLARPLRVALIGFGPSAADATDARAIETSLQEALARDGRVQMVEPAQLQAALAGIKYDGSINMSKDEARRIGGALGCDFFVLGKAEVFTRSEREKEEHEEAFIGVMIVDGRGGSLAAFDFLNDRGATKKAALSAVIKLLDRRASSYVERMSQFRRERESSDPAQPQRDKNTTASDLEKVTELEKVEDMPDAGSALGAEFKPGAGFKTGAELKTGAGFKTGDGFKAPEFLNRVKPEYTEEANMANLVATVEARAVFRANGEVGEIEITRWAGFGLDEAAERAIRQLKFKPATRDGRAVSVRASVRYNFRRARES